VCDLVFLCLLLCLPLRILHRKAAAQSRSVQTDCVNCQLTLLNSQQVILPLSSTVPSGKLSHIGSQHWPPSATLTVGRSHLGELRRE
jgi:hypothetical protein